PATSGPSPSSKIGCSGKSVHASHSGMPVKVPLGGTISAPKSGPSSGRSEPPPLSMLPPAPALAGPGPEGPPTVAPSPLAPPAEQAKPANDRAARPANDRAARLPPASKDPQRLRDDDPCIGLAPRCLTARV